MDNSQVKWTRTIKYTIDPTSGATRRINTMCPAGVRPGNAPAVYEVTDIPSEVTDQHILELFSLFLSDNFVKIGIYSYPYALLAKAVTTQEVKWMYPTFGQHVQVIMAKKGKKLSHVIDYLAGELDKTPMTLWTYWRKNETPRDTLIAINWITHEILEGRRWKND